MFRRSVTVGLLVLSVILVSRAVSSAGQPYLGISLAAKLPPSVAAHLEIEGGAMIIAVIDGSPAAQAGWPAPLRGAVPPGVAFVGHGLSPATQA